MTIQQTVNGKFIHLTLTIVLVYVGGILVLPFNTFGTSESWKLFALMNQQESFWGLAFLSSGALGLVGAESDRPWLRAIGLASVAVAHTLIGIAFFFSNPIGVGAAFGLFGLQGYYMLYKMVF